MDWARILAYITGTVDQELLSRNEYLVTENRILKRQIKGRLLLSDAEDRTRRSPPRKPLYACAAAGRKNVLSDTSKRAPGGSQR